MSASELTMLLKCYTEISELSLQMCFGGSLHSTHADLAKG